MIYAVLCNPGHNRVYFEASLKLSVSEFSVASQKFSVESNNIIQQNIEGVDYLTFETRGELSESDIKIVSGLSFAYAIFKIENINGMVYLKPIKRIKNDFTNESIGTILKYTGKTNEIFTRMMINIAYYSQENTEKIKLLDPVAGKGTTLFEGLIKGFDVYGIEIGSVIVNEAYHYVKKFFETEKYKFDYTSIKISGPNKSFSAFKHTFETAVTKEDFKNKNTKCIEFIAGNSIYADKFYKKNYFDIIVGDLPYGVQHGNVTNEKQTSLTRNPSELLNACLPPWREVLKPKGVIVLAWNTNVLPRKDIERIFEENGFFVKNNGAYVEFAHKVDQSIARDIITAVKL